ncbi:MAG: carboxypeptidase-like regulatory domain-containing protein [Planctomycetes bacterium]|nr:carboxypeptidase-like regulatory domain-containing protein [Planctomycetota bacterium]
MRIPNRSPLLVFALWLVAVCAGIAWWSMRSGDTTVGASALPHEVTRSTPRDVAAPTGIAERAGAEVGTGALQATDDRTQDPSATEAADEQRGRVQDALGRRVADIQVLRAVPFDAQRPAQPLARTDAAGEFVWTDTTWAELIAESDELTTVLPIYASSSERAIVVAPRRAYAGVVVDEAGTPLAHAELDVQMGDDVARALLPGERRASARRWTALSGDDGRFELPHVGWTEGLMARVRLDGFVEGREPLPPQSTFDLVFTLRRPVADARTVTGRVIDEHGEPVEGATVAFARGDQTTSAADGRFVARLPDATKHGVLWAVKFGHLPASREFDDLDLDPQPARPPIELVLGGAPLSISGSVLDASGGPVAGAKVFTWDMQPLGRGVFVESLLVQESFAGQTETDGGGRFRLDGLLERQYALLALHPGSLAVAEIADVAAGSENVVLRFTSSETPRRVAGRVVDGRGQPVPGLFVFRGRDAAPGHERLLAPLVVEHAPVTDANGAFEFPAMCVNGAYLLVAGDGIAMQDRRRLDAAEDLEHLELRVSLECRFQVVLADPDEADGFQVRDVNDSVLPLTLELGDVIVSGNGFFDLAGGRSEVALGDERAHSLVLAKGGVEVRRVPLALAPGELRIVTP